MDDMIFSARKLAAALNGGSTSSVVERKLKAYTGDDYYAISWPTTLRVFRNNLEDIQMYTSEGFRMIANGEIGRYYNTRYVEQTNIAKAGWTYTDWIFFFGADTVAEAIAVPEEMRGGFCPAAQQCAGNYWLN